MHAARSALLDASRRSLARRCSACALRLILAGSLPLAAAAAAAQAPDLVQVAVASSALSESAGAGGSIDFAGLRAQRDAISRSLQALEQAAGQGAKRERAAREDPLQRLQRTWRSIAYASDRLLGLEQQVADAHQHSERIGMHVPGIQARLDELARSLRDAKDAGGQGYVLNRQMLLQERLLRSTREMLAGGPSAMSAADRLQRDMTLLTRVQEGLSKGNPELGIAAIESEAARALSLELSAALSEQAESVDALVNALALDLWNAQELSAQIRTEVRELQQDLLDLAKAWR